MGRASKIHLFLSGMLAAIGISALYFRWNGLISGTVVVLVDVYLIAMLYEALHRSNADRKIVDGILMAKPVYLFPFPSRTWTGLLIVFIVGSSISGFANIYICSADIVYVGPTVEAANLETESETDTPPTAIMENRVEALYFSLGTMMTLGYGDFLPTSRVARMLVMWQLATGGLLAIGIFPLIISRAADF